MLARSETLKDEHVEFILNSYPNKTTEYFCHVELGFYNCLSGILSHNLSVYNQAVFVKLQWLIWDISQGVHSWGSQENFWLDMANNLQVKILTLSKEVYNTSVEFE